MDTYKLIKNLKEKIEILEKRIRRDKIKIYIDISVNALFLVAALSLLIIYFTNKDKNLLIISLGLFAVLIVFLTMLAFDILLLNNDKKSIINIKKSLESWENKKPWISVPRQFNKDNENGEI